PGVLCGAEAMNQIDDMRQMSLGLGLRPLCRHHVSVLLCVLLPLFAGLAGRPPHTARRWWLSWGMWRASALLAGNVPAEGDLQLDEMGIPPAVPLPLGDVRLDIAGPPAIVAV